MKKILFLVGLALVPLVAETAKTDQVKEDLACLKANLFFEARGESAKGKAAVAKVTINRVKSKRYPASTCKVVFQKAQFSWTLQQPWGKIQRVMQGDLRGYSALDRVAYQESKKIAEKALKTGLNVLPDNVLHYHADYVSPKWAKKMQVVKKIDKHVFLVEPKKRKTK